MKLKASFHRRRQAFEAREDSIEHKAGNRRPMALKYRSEKLLNNTR